MRRAFIVFVVAFVAMGGVISGGLHPSRAGATLPCEAGNVVYVNTLPGHTVDGYVDGSLTFRHLPPGGVVGAFEYRASPFFDCRSRPRLQLFDATSAPPNAAPVSGALVDGSFFVDTLEHVDVVVGSSLGGTRRLERFPTDVRNQWTLLAVRNVGNHAPIDVYYGGSKRATALATGKAAKFLASPNATSTLLLTETGTMTPVVPAVSVRPRPGITYEYLTTRPDGSAPRLLSSFQKTIVGYRLVTSDGGVFTYGRSRFYGSAGALPLRAPVVGGAATSTGNGYWLVAADGGVFTYGDARFFGSAGALQLAAPIVAMAPTPTDRGYWLFAADGGVFTYGDARFFGSAGALRLAAPVVGGAATQAGRGYVLLGRDGGVFVYGDGPGTAPIGHCDAPPSIATISTGQPFFVCDRLLVWTRTFNAPTFPLSAGEPPVSLLPSVTGDGVVVAYANGAIALWGQVPDLGSPARSGITLRSSVVAVIP